MPNHYHQHLFVKYKNSISVNPLSSNVPKCAALILLFCILFCLIVIRCARRFYFSRGESGESRTILHFIHYAGSKLMIFHYSVKCLCDRIAIVNFMHDLSIVLIFLVELLHIMHLIDSCKCIKVFAAVCLFTDL
jgi:hypothetical protein